MSPPAARAIARRRSHRGAKAARGRAGSVGRGGADRSAPQELAPRASPVPLDGAAGATTGAGSDPTCRRSAPGRTADVPAAAERRSDDGSTGRLAAANRPWCARDSARVANESSRPDACASVPDRRRRVACGAAACRRPLPTRARRAAPVTDGRTASAVHPTAATGTPTALLDRRAALGWEAFVSDAIRRKAVERGSCGSDSVERVAVEPGAVERRGVEEAAGVRALVRASAGVRPLVRLGALAGVGSAGTRLASTGVFVERAGTDVGGRTRAPAVVERHIASAR